MSLRPGLIQQLSLSRKIGVVPSGSVPTASSLEIVSGQGQSATVSQALPAPLVVRVRDQFGNPFLGQTVTSAVNSGAGGITPASVVTGADGLASFTATVGAVAGFNSFAISSSSLSGSPAVFTATGVAVGGNWDLTTNVPAGMSLVVDTEWLSSSEAAADGWDLSSDGVGTSGPIFVSDGTAPDGAAGCIDQRYTGVPDGFDPNRYSRAFTTTNEIFYSTIVKFSPGWDFGPSGIKFILLQGAGNQGWLSLQRSGIAPENGLQAGIGWAKAGISGGDPTHAPLTTIRLQRDVWYKIQFRARTSAGGGQLFQIWIDDVLYVNTTAGSFPFSSFNNLSQGSTWGGGNGFSAPTMWARHARTALWRR